MNCPKMMALAVVAALALLAGCGKQECTNGDYTTDAGTCCPPEYPYYDSYRGGTCWMNYAPGADDAGVYQSTPSKQPTE